RVIHADALALLEVAQDQNKGAADPPADTTRGDSAAPAPRAAQAGDRTPTALPQQIKEEKDLEPYERLFANTAYWKQIGEEYQNPLIVTGTVLFTAHSRSGMVTREQEMIDAYGRHRVIPVRTYMDRKGFILRPKFVFI